MKQLILVDKMGLETQTIQSDAIKYTPQFSHIN